MNYRLCAAVRSVVLRARGPVARKGAVKVNFG